MEYNRVVNPVHVRGLTISERLLAFRMRVLIAFIGIVALLALGIDGARSLDGEKPAALSYWQRVLPDTPIPDALKDLIPSQHLAHILQATDKQVAKATGSVNENVAGRDENPAGLHPAGKATPNPLLYRGADEDASKATPNIFLYRGADENAGKATTNPLLYRGADEDASKATPNIFLYRGADENAGKATPNLFLYRGADENAGKATPNPLLYRGADEDASKATPNIFLYRGADENVADLNPAGEATSKHGHATN